MYDTIPHQGLRARGGGDVMDNWVSLHPGITLSGDMQTLLSLITIFLNVQFVRSLRSFLAVCLFLSLTC